ncbi:MAG: DUF294 nucleotidyltransferase-like domain-containing protein [Nocardioides sp.]
MQEFIDFLGKQAPYDALDADDLHRLANRVEVEFYPRGALIIEPDGEPLERLAVVRTGLVHLLDQGRVVDERGPGDTFGHLSLLSGIAPTVSAQAATDTLLYLLPDPRGVVSQPERLVFRRAKQASKAVLLGAADYGLRPVSDFARDPLWCRADTPIRQAARVMTEQRQSCILVELPASEGGGYGIVTDSDCRSRVATGEIGIDAPIAQLATSPVRTLERSEPATMAFQQMVQHGVHHLVLVDGDDRPTGVCRVVDLASTDIRDPLAVRAAIDAADTLDELVAAAGAIRPAMVDLFDAGVPALRVGGLLAALIESVLEKCVSWVEPFGGDDESRFSWLFLGSLARREPLPGSDVDTGLIWRTEEYDERPELLTTAASRVLDHVEACGLERCASGANASNPLFNRSYRAWVEVARSWNDFSAGTQSLVLVAMITDSRPVTGLELGRRFERKIRKVPSQAWFRPHPRRGARGETAGGLVRDFVVESDGEHRGQLDIKRRALYPIVQIGRWAAVTTGEPVLGTQTGSRSRPTPPCSPATPRVRCATHDELTTILEAEVEDLRHGRPPSPYLDPWSLDSLSAASCGRASR